MLAVFTLGLLLGGTLTGLVIWLLSGLAAPLPPYARATAILLIATAGVAREFNLLSIPLPQNARQIPQEVLQRHLRLGTLQFGFELGTGVRTYVSASTPYVAALALLLSHQPPLQTALTGTAFGLGRALSAALTYASRDPDRPTTIATRITPITRLAITTTLAALSLLIY